MKTLLHVFHMLADNCDYATKMEVYESVQDIIYDTMEAQLDSQDSNNIFIEELKHIGYRLVTLSCIENQRNVFHILMKLYKHMKVNRIEVEEGDDNDAKLEYFNEYKNCLVQTEAFKRNIVLFNRTCNQIELDKAQSNLNTGGYYQPMLVQAMSDKRLFHIQCDLYFLISVLNRNAIVEKIKAPKE